MPPSERKPTTRQRYSSIEGVGRWYSVVPVMPRPFFFYPSEQGGKGELWSELCDDELRLKKVEKKVQKNLRMSKNCCIFVIEKENNIMTIIKKILCPACYGKGYYRDHIHDGYCWKCYGKGYINKVEEIPNK